MTANSSPARPWWVTWGCVVGGALLYACAFPPIGLWPLACVAVAPWAVAIHGATPWQGAVRSWVFAVVAYLAGCAWLITLVASPIVAWLLLAPAAATLFWAPMGALVAWWRRRLGWSALTTVPVAFLASEWFRLQWSIGFSYLFVGHPLAEAPVLAQVASLGGAAACSLLCVALGAAIADLVALRSGWAGAPDARTAWRGTAVVAGAWGLATLYGIVTFRTEFTPGPVVAGVQANVPQRDKQGRTLPITDLHERLSREALRVMDRPPALLCWPETMADPLSMDGGAMVRMQGLARELGCPLLIGTVGSGMVPGGDTAQRWNSAMLFDAEGGLRSRYDKHRLVMPTETLPTRDLWPVSESIMVALAGGVPDLEPGHRTGVLAVPGPADLRVGVLICYESASGALTRRWVREGASVLVNLTNEAWFPESSQFAQMWQQCRLRCIETRTPMVRVANTGWSGGIAPNGRDVLCLREDHGGETGEHFHLAVPLDGRGTLYRWLGDWCSWLALLGVLALSGWSWRRPTAA